MADPYDTLTTMLTANWDTNVIALPKFFNLKLKNFDKPNCIGFNFANSPMVDANPGDDIHYRVWPVDMIIFATSNANRELIIEELLKQMRAYDNASIKYKVNTGDDWSRRQGVFMVNMIGEEQNFVEVSAW